MITEIVDNILTNPVVTGLSTTAVLGGVIYHLKDLPNRVMKLIKGQCTVQVSLANLDPSYAWLEIWVTSRRFLIEPRSLTLKTNDTEEDVYQKGPKKWMMTPGDGTHFFMFGHTLAWISKEIKDLEKITFNGPQLEKLTITLLSRDSKRLRDVITEAHQYATQASIVPVYMYKGWWSRICGKETRSLESIVLNEGQLERIVNDLDWFKSARDWYAERGIPYRRGYLFSGPPGTGKSSLVFALASYLRRPLCVLNISSVDSDNDLFGAITDSPSNAIILLEDIDAIKASSHRRSKSKLQSVNINKDDDEDDNEGVSKAGLLNALDGILTPENRIFILTSNYPENLDEALIRPGRADLHERIEYLEPKTQVRMMSKFYEEQFEPLDYPVAPVHLQAAAMMYPSDIEKARQYLKNLNSENL